MAKDESKDLTTVSEQELAQYATEAAAKERPSTSAISFRGGVMTYEDNPMPDNELTCIVVNHCFENRWYEGQFDPDNIDLPRCFAIAMEKEDLRPHANADAQAEVCSKCSKNEWGSDPRPNSRGKACKEIRRLTVIPYGESLVPENVGEAEVAMIKLPVTSVKNWSNYVNKVGASLKRPPWSVVTKIKVVPDQKTQFKVLFDCVGPVDTEYLGPLNAKRDSVLPVLTAPYDPPSEEEESQEDNESTKY